MNQLLAQSKVDLRELARDFASLGDQGRLAFMQINNELSKFNMQAKNVSAVTQKIWNTVGNTVRWGIISNGFQSVLDSVNRATGYVKELDRSLTDIRLVSNYSAQEMQRFAEQANKAAKALGSTTVAYTDASAIFVQQGMSLDNAEKMADLTIKVSNITGQTTSEVSEQITAWMNGYQLQAEELQRTLDSVVKVAAVSAADTEEIMTAASKVASTASTVGVSTDQLIAQMATIISTTREAPEAVGNAMKTIYSRLSSLKLGETLEDNVTLNSMTATLEKIGVQVLDDNNDLRDMGTIIEELQQKWVDLSDAQKMAASVQLAGRYQLNRFLALMNNQDYYKQMMSAAEGSGGFLDEKQAVYLESLEGHLNTLKASIEGIATVGLDTDDFNDFLEVLTDITDGIGTAVDAVGGFGPLIQSIGPILLKTFSSNIADSVTRFSGNIEQATMKINNLKYANDLAKITNDEIYSSYGRENEAISKLVSELTKLNELRINSNASLSLESQQQLNQAFEQGTEVLQRYLSLEKQQEEARTRAIELQDFFQVNEKEGLTNLGWFQQMWEENGIKEGNLISQKTKTPGKDRFVLTAQGAELLNQQINAGVKAGESFELALQKIEKALGKTFKEVEQLDHGINDLAIGTETISQSFNQLGKQLTFKEFVNSATRAISTLGQLVMGVQMLQGAFEKLNDETIEDPVERFNQSIIDLSLGLGMVLPMLGEGADKFLKYAKASNVAKKADEELQAAQELKKSMKEAYLGLSGNFITDSKGRTQRAGGKGFASKKEIEELATASKNYENALKNVETANKRAKIAHNATFGATAKAMVETLIGTVNKLKIAIAGAFNAHPVLLSLGLIAAAVGGIALAWNNVFSDDAKNKKHQEELNKKAQELTASYGTLRDDLESVYSNVAAAEDARKALETLTAGTKEWDDKVKEVNTHIQEVLDKHPELSKMLIETETGQVLDPEQYAEWKKGQERESFNTGLQSAAAQEAANPEQNDLTIASIDLGKKYLQVPGVLNNTEEIPYGALAAYSYNNAESLYNPSNPELEEALKNLENARYTLLTQGNNENFSSNLEAWEQAYKHVNEILGAAYELSDNYWTAYDMPRQEGAARYATTESRAIKDTYWRDDDNSSIRERYNNDYEAYSKDYEEQYADAAQVWYREKGYGAVRPFENINDDLTFFDLGNGNFGYLNFKNSGSGITFDEGVSTTNGTATIENQYSSILDDPAKALEAFQNDYNIALAQLTGAGISKERATAILDAWLSGDLETFNSLIITSKEQEAIERAESLGANSAYGLSKIKGANILFSNDNPKDVSFTSFSTIFEQIEKELKDNKFSEEDIESFQEGLPSFVSEFFNGNELDFASFIEEMGGITSFYSNFEEIKNLFQKGFSAKDVKDQLDISEWQHSLDDNKAALEGYLGKDQQLIDNITESFVEATGQADKFSDEQKSTYALLTVASQNAAKHLLETYKDAIEQFNSEDIIIHETGFRSLQLDLSNLLGIPFEKITEDYVQQLIDEDLLEGMFTGDSKAIQTGQELWLAGIEGVDQAIAERVVTARDQIAESPDEFSDILNGILNDKTLNITPEIEQAILAMFNSMRLEDGTIVQFDIGVGEATVALSDFAKALTDTDSEIGKAIAQKLGSNVDISEETAKNIEDAYRSTLTNSDYIYGFNDNQAAQILSASIANPELLEKQYLDQIKALYGEGSNGYTLEEAIQKVIQDIQDNNWFSNRAGWTKKAQELGLTLEEFETKVNKYKEDHGLENLDEAAQKLAEELQEEAEANKKTRTDAVTAIKGIRQFGNEKDIQAAVDQLKLDQISGYIEWLQQSENIGKEANAASAQEYQESLNKTPWWSTDTKQAEHIKELGYDLDKYSQYYQEFLKKYEGNLEAAANLAVAQLENEQRIAELEEQKAKEKEAQTKLEERQLAALKAGQGIAEQYRSKEGFSLSTDMADMPKLKDFKESFATMLGETVDSLAEQGFTDEDYVRIANSQEFQSLMRDGNMNYWDDVIGMMTDAGYKTNNLKLNLVDFFKAVVQKTEETKEVVLRSLQDIITNFLQIVQNLNEGDIISADKYDALVEQLGSEAVDKYFTTMADGTHMLVGAADEFKQNAMNTARVQIGEQLQQAISREKDSRIADYGDNSELAPSDIGGNYHSDDVKMFTEMEFSTAETLEQLQHFAKATEEMGVSSKIILDAYNENLLRLGMNYENATDEVKAFKEAQASGNEERIAAAQRDLEGSIAIGEDQSLKELDLDPTEIDDYADHLQDLAAMEEDAYLGGEKLADSLEEDEEAAAMLSKQLSRMNRAVGTLEKNWDDWADVLQNSSKGSKEYFDAMQSTRSAMSDLLDISEDFISADLVDSLANNAENMELMQRAAEGDGEAIDQLRQLALNDIIVKITEDNQLDPDFLSTQIAAIQEMLPDIEVGATVDDTALINALQEMIDQAGMTKDQVNALLGSMGFDANFVTDQQPVETTIPVYTTHYAMSNKQTHEVANGDGTTGTVETYDLENWTEVTGHRTVEGTAAEFAMSTSAPGEGGGTPILGSITRKASGSANNYSSSNRGGNGGGGKGSGGGGGGKGGGGSSKKNQADPIEKEKDRYQKVNEQIAKTVAEYDQLTEAQDRLLGPELAMNLEEQNEKLEEQIDLQKEKLRIQREEQRDRQKDLSQYGIQFNPDGTISNYSEVWDAQNAKLEAARQAYNGTDTDDEAAKEAWEAAQAYFDDFAEGITKYDSLLESIYDTNSELQNLRNAIDDLSKSIVETAYDSLNSLQDLDDTMAEVRLNLSDPFGDDIWKQLESATDRLSDWFQMDEESANTAYNSLINQAQKLMDKTTDKAEKESLQRYIDNARSDLNSGSTGYLDMWNAQTNNLLKEYNDLMTTGSNKSGLSAGSLHELMDTAFGDGAEKLGSLVDQLQKARDLALDAMDEINDKFEDRKEQYEVINDELEHQLELSEMLHGDQAYAEQEKVLQAQLNNSKGQLGIAAEQVKLYEAWSKNAIEGTEEWKKANELLTDAQKDYNEQVEKAVELTQKLYENTINSQLDKWIQNALGNDMDWVQEEWELIQRNAEQYLDDVEKAYNIQKLQNSYEDLLNQSNQLDIQQQITDQMNQQLGYLRGKTQLSKYDVDYANAQLEILQRQIALEEARRNKNQMRLSRDAQGNYSYVYTANRDDVNNAESGLLDAQFNAYNLSKQNIIDSQSNALSALNDFYSSAQAIATNYNLSEEERAARLQSLWDYNREYLQGCAEQLGTSFENIQNDFYGMVDALEDINEGNLTEWTQRLKDGTMDMTMVMSEILSDAIFDWLTKFENFELDTYAVISQMLDSWNEYTTGLTDMGASVGETIGDITEATQQCVEQTNKLTESQSGFFDLLEKQAGTVDNYLTQMQGYADTIANLEGQMSQYKDNMEKLEKILRENYISYELNGELVDNSKKPSGGNGGNGKGGSGNGSGGKGSGAGGKTSNGTKFTNEELIEGVAGNIWTYGSWANDPTRAGDLARKFGADMAVAIQQFVNRGMEALTHDWTTGYYRQFGIDAFATGGYTGSWDGGDGKLAILDSKELVLNAKDTENMLAAVNLVREVVRSMQGTTLSSGLSSLNGAFSSAASTVDQNVTITANFPNATSESEIKSAILGLVDQSVQYSARTKPTGKVF